jgi:hypothetical protein
VGQAVSPANPAAPHPAAFARIRTGHEKIPGASLVIVSTSPTNDAFA